MFTDFLKQIGLEYLIKDAEKTVLNNFVKEAFEQKLPELSEKEIKELFVYDVPKISADGSCSILDEKSDTPYNLANTYGLENDWTSLKNSSHALRLWQFKQIVKHTLDQTGVDWLGIYRKVKNPEGNLVLIKESYLGVFSRPEFPLTEEFAKKSNNSTVGLTGKVVVVQDVFAYKGSYYKCDGNVQSEFCVPIVSPDNEIIGIIDAEAFPKNFMTNERLLQIAKVAYELGQINLGI